MENRRPIGVLHITEKNDSMALLRAVKIWPDFDWAFHFLLKSKKAVQRFFIEGEVASRADRSVKNSTLIIASQSYAIAELTKRFPQKTARHDVKDLLT